MESTLGRRHRCFECGCAFFDLGKSKVICPRCGADQKKSPKPSVAAKAKAARAKAEDGDMGPFHDENELAEEFDAFDKVDIDEDALVEDGSIGVIDDEEEV